VVEEAFVCNVQNRARTHAVLVVGLYEFNAIVLSVRLRFTGSDYPFDIFKLFGMYFPNFHDDRYNYINNNEIKV
jgi:hypothetical protein